ncbi:MAG TPA: succinylglutamate desuccinylase/aspartoacylase family protein [bacterium]|nr:succinylglutamate desuccinylase/aspartoacylase family protein [bacterium]
MNHPIALAMFDLAGLGPGRHACLARAVDAPAADLPVLAVVGVQPGPTLVATGGVHGDEYEGPLALWRVAAELRPDEMHGALVALPICNPWAAAAGRRATPEAIDGVNLARTFPGDADGSPTQRLAAALLGCVLRLRPALVLDLHSGGVLSRFHPMVGYRRGLGDAVRSQAAARAFGLPALWELRDHPGTFNAETARRGIPTIGVEMTGTGAALEADVAANRAGALNLLRWLGVLRDRPAPETPGPFRRMTDVPATADGYVVPLREVGEPVAEGDPLVRVLTAFGEIAEVVRAPHAGIVWVMRHLRTIRTGETACAVAAE